MTPNPIHFIPDIVSFSITMGNLYTHTDADITLRLVAVDHAHDRMLGIVRLTDGAFTWQGSPIQFFSHFKPYKPK